MSLLTTEERNLIRDFGVPAHPGADLVAWAGDVPHFTLKGREFYAEVSRALGVPFSPMHINSRKQLLSFNRRAFLAHARAVGDELERCLLAGEIPAQERAAVEVTLFGSDDEALTAWRKVDTLAKAGDNVIALPKKNRAAQSAARE